MPKSKKLPTTVYLEPEVSRAIRVKAAVSGRTVSDLANDGLRRILREDEDHLRIIRERKREMGKARPYEDVLREFKRRGLL